MLRNPAEEARNIWGALDLSNFDVHWLPSRTVFLGIGGSHAYGFARPDSDIDIRGVTIPPMRYALGFIQHFEQFEASKPHDIVVMALQKFVKLAADANPNILEQLFYPEEEWVVSSPTWKKLISIRGSFLSKKCAYTHAGYATSQLKRIERHRAWLLHPPKKKPKRGDFGLPERSTLPREQLDAINAAIQKKLDEWALDLSGLSPSRCKAITQQIESYLEEIQIGHAERELSAMRVIGLDDNLIRIVETERAYRHAMDNFHRYEEWKKNRNPARAEAEAKWGFDCKHAGHLFRLLKQAEEILTKATITLPRPVDEIETVLAIRQGAWKFDDLLQWAKDAHERTMGLAQSSLLPKEPDRHLIEKVLIDVTLEYAKSSA